MFKLTYQCIVKQIPRGGKSTRGSHYPYQGLMIFCITTIPVLGVNV